MTRLDLRPKRRRLRRTSPPALRFSPYAWAKLLFLHDRGPTEIGGFGVSAAEDLLRVEDFRLVPQVCSAITVRLDDLAVADYFDEQVELGLVPQQFARLWLHTHPGSSAQPSRTDEATFARCFGTADWAVMFILACGGRSYARLRFSAGPGGELLLPVELDFSEPFPAADPAAWDAEYQRCVTFENASRLGYDDCLDAQIERDGWSDHQPETKLAPLRLVEGGYDV